MLLQIAPHIADCLERARLSRERAEKEANPEVKADFLEIERRWLRIAEAYRTIERQQNFITEASRLRDEMTRSETPSDAEVERLAERMIGSSKSKL